MRKFVGLCAAALALVIAAPAAADSTELFFSEYIEGSSQNKALEIYNGTGASVDLAASGYSVFMSFNGGTFTRDIPLTGTVATGDVYVLAQATADPAILAQADQTDTSTSWFNGDDFVALRKGGVTVDGIGQLGFDPGSQWGSGDTSTADNTLRRMLSVEAGDTNETDPFVPAAEWDGFPTNTFDGLGFHGEVANEPVLASCGSDVTILQGGSASKTVTATDADGRVLDISIAVSPSPAPGSIAVTGQTPAAADGDTASATISIGGAIPASTYTVNATATNDDATPQTGTCTFTVTVTGIRTIGEVQGSVGPADDGLLHRSPFAPPTGNGTGQQVVVRGVVYEKTRNGSNRGIFIQNTAAQADGDPFTSDGLFVFIGGFDTILRAEGGPAYTPQIGDEIVLRGNVVEFFNLTQLSSPRLMEVTGSFLDLDAVVPAVEADPPTVVADANRYWERLEDMRVRVPAGARVLDGLDVFSGPDSEMWVMRGDNPLASRTDPYAQRSFRDPHPLDNDPALFDDGNGYRILVGAFGVKGAAGSPNVNLSPARTFDTMTNDLVGGVYFNFGKYAVMTVNQPELTHGIDPSLNNPPTAPNRAVEYSVGDYNVENLYDFRDDPFDGCDFAGNSGCPGVRPPFNYVPESDADYQERLGLIADQIVEDLHAPDVILVQEAEDQDICAVVSGSLDCDDGVNDRDGRPDTLQELALRIQAEHGIAYDAAYDRDGSDDRGIVAALMYRTDRVELLEPTADHPVLGSDPEVEYRVPGNAYNADVQNPKSLNAPLPGDVDTSSGTDGSEVYTRDPQVGWFRVWRTAVGIGTFVDVYAISNHFSSGPDGRRGQRKEQAAYLAAIVEALDADRVVAGGDFNVFPRPDDPVPAGPVTDQLGPLYDIGLWNVWDTMVAENPSSAYSYVFIGQAQTLDGQFISPTLHDELEQSRVAHVNADFPAEFDGDGARGLSDHDPMASRFELAVTLDGLEALLAYYRDAGEIRGANTYAQLLHHLTQARSVGDAQLQAFVNQVQGKAPQFIDQEIADALAAEARLVIAAS